MTDFGFWSVIPPLLAIGLAIRTRQVVFSLTFGIFVGYLIQSGGNPFHGFLQTIASFVNVFQSEGNTRTVILTLIIGALIQLIKHAGGINGFVAWVQKRSDRERRTQQKIQVATAFTGFLIFIESNISILTVGTIFRPLFDKNKIPREKLAYLIDSSSAPSCILFPMNAWGAYIMGLLMVYEQLDPFQTLIYAIPFNFYALFTLAFVFFIASTGRDFGPMKKVTYGHYEKQADRTETTSTPLNMIVPIAMMVVSMPFFLIYSGWESNAAGTLSDKVWMSIGRGSGSQAVLNACFLALLTAAILYIAQKRLTLKSLFSESFNGMGEMLEMAVLMVLAFSIGGLCNELGTGTYVAQLATSYLNPQLAPMLIFLISAFIAFSTGTSWGTFAIMMSIALPVAFSLETNVYIMVGAVLGGGVFGDHCSPISDTTLISSLASGCNHIDHVKTQLPYALATGLLASLFYLLAGILL